MARFKRGKRKFRGRKRKFRSASNRRFAKRVKRAVYQLAEHKYLDNSAGNFVITNAGIIEYMDFPLPQGSTEQNRVGLKIKVRSLKLRLNLSSSSNANHQLYDNVRIIIGCWKDYISSSPSAANILLAPTLLNSPYLRTMLEEKKWIPMYDRVHTVAYPTATGATGFPAQKFINLSFHGKKLPLKTKVFQTNSLPNNTYFALILSNFVGTPGGEPVVNFISRMTYTDVRGSRD